MSLIWRPGFQWWDPSLISTELWLDAADASTIDESGGAVSQWDDKSGNGRNATQATPANRPVYTANAINGLSVLTFATTPKSLVMPSGVYATNPKIFGVIKSTSNSVAQVPLRIQGSVNEFLFIFNATTSNQVYFTRRNLEQRPVTHDQTNTTIYFGDLFSTSIGDYYINGSLKTKGTSLGLAGGKANANVIGIDAPPNVGDFQGELAEYIVTSAIDTDTRQRVEGYLAHKWGLTANLPSDHPYKINAPAP